MSSCVHKKKQTRCLPLFSLCIGLEKKWDFYLRRPSSRTPAAAGQTRQRQTINRQKAPALAQAHVQQPLSLHGASCFSQSLPHCLNTQRLFNTLSENQSIIPIYCQAQFSSTEVWAPPRGLWMDPNSMSYRMRVHGPREAQKRILSS